MFKVKFFHLIWRRDYLSFWRTSVLFGGPLIHLLSSYVSPGFQSQGKSILHFRFIPQVHLLCNTCLSLELNWIYFCLLTATMAADPFCISFVFMDFVTNYVKYRHCTTSGIASESGTKVKCNSNY